MNAPAVRLHPDGRAVVRLPVHGDRPWLAVTASHKGGLHVELFTEDEAAGWPEYGPPS